jgi:hypothetical protein
MLSAHESTNRELKLSLMLISALAIIVALSLSVSNANSLTMANTTDFSTQVPNSWIYGENLHLYNDLDNNIILTPDDFAARRYSYL